MGEGDSREVVLYALSTCGWCRQARAWLDDNHVEYECVYVDHLEGDEKDKTMSGLKERLGRRPAFPTVFCGEQFVIGFNKPQLKELLDL